MAAPATTSAPRRPSEVLGNAIDGVGIVPEFEGAAGVPLVLTRAGADKLLMLSSEVPSLAAVGSSLGAVRVATKDPGWW